MKFIISQFLIAFALISIICESECQHENVKNRLSRVFENINSRKNSQQERDDIAENIDMDCVKNLLKLPQNNKMLVNQLEETVFKAASYLKCSDEKKIFNEYSNIFVHNGMKKQLTCLIWHLQRLEPTSKLVENFEITEDGIKECDKNFPIEEIESEIGGVTTTLGPLSAFTCGAVTDNWVNDFLRFVSKGSIIKYGDINEELKQAETKKLMEYFKEITFGTANCITKRFEDDPEGIKILIISS